LFEVRAHCEDLMNNILHAEDVIFAKRLLDGGIVGKRNTLLVELAISALIDQLADRLKVGLSEQLSARSTAKPSDQL